jgi:hypothetical protein
MPSPQFARLPKFCAFAAVSRVCRGFLGIKPPGFDLLHKVGGTLFIYMLNVKIHGVAQRTRPVASVLGSEGLVLITHG